MENAWVLASSNEKKIAEIRQLLGEFEELTIVSQKELGIHSPEEPFASFLENALYKARHAAKIANMPALADDSGLCVESLNGEPGVFSARFAGHSADDQKNNALLLKRLGHQTNRRAFFVCVFVWVKNEKDPLPVVAQGLWLGQILTQAKGQNGFGYDPLFLPDGLSQSAAELSATEKNVLSHRAKALQNLKKALQERLILPKT